MTQTNDKQRIVFQQGGPLDGDSGERGNDTAADGGVESVKPLNDGERAHQVVFRRPEDNLRRRTEVLRDAGEQQKYLEDQMRWAFTPGRDDGTALGPVLSLAQIIWNSTTGIFSLTEDVVLQPLNTPEVDMQETVDYPFDDGTTTTQISFNMVPGSASEGRAYNGANLVNIVWAEVPVVDLAAALVPSYCDIVISGDPDHVLTISIRDDDLTAMSHVQTALATLGVPALQAIGLQATIIPVVSTFLEYVDITTPDYVLEKNFDRELHYIPTTSWDDFFTSLGRGINDGETVAIRWASYVDPFPGVTGRRQSIPSNVPAGSTLVLGSQLFSTTEHPEWIPFSIPVCKRVAQDLWWLDGTVMYGVDPIPSNPVYMGEHGYTVERILNAPDDVPLNITQAWYTTNPPTWAATATVNTAINGILDDLSRGTTGGGAVEIGKEAYPDPGGYHDWSNHAVWFAASDSVGIWLNTLLVEVNKCARMHKDGDESIFADWHYSNPLFFNVTEDDSVIVSHDPLETIVYMRKPSEMVSMFTTGNPDAWTSRTIQGAHTKQAESPDNEYTFNRPLRGFHCRNGVDQSTTPGETKGNNLFISGGEAYVRGRLMRLDDYELTNVWVGVVGKGGMTANTKTELSNATNFYDNCMPMYVWLRSDGTYHIDGYGVNFAGNHGQKDSMFYSPHPDSGLIAGGWDDWDYTLIDVCWLVQGKEEAGVNTIRLAGYIPMGGGYNMLENALYTVNNGAAWSNLYPVIKSDAAGIEASLDINPSTNFASPNENMRCPGIPVVSNLAHCSIVGKVDMTACTRTQMYAALGATNVPMHRTLMAAEDTPIGAYTIMGTTGINGTVNGVFLSWAQGEAWESIKQAQGNVVVTRGLDPAAGLFPTMWTTYRHWYQSAAGVDATSVRITMYLWGFWWDKFAAPSVFKRQDAT